MTADLFIHPPCCADIQPIDDILVSEINLVLVSICLSILVLVTVLSMDIKTVVKETIYILFIIVCECMIYSTTTHWLPFQCFKFSISQLFIQSFQSNIYTHFSQQFLMIFAALANVQKCTEQYALNLGIFSGQ